MVFGDNFMISCFVEGDHGIDVFVDFGGWGVIVGFVEFIGGFRVDVFIFNYGKFSILLRIWYCL